MSKKVYWKESLCDYSEGLKFNFVPKPYKEVKKVFEQQNKKLYFIGKVIEEVKYLLRNGGKIKEVPFKGWQHFVGNAKDLVLNSVLDSEK